MGMKIKPLPWGCEAGKWRTLLEPERAIQASLEWLEQEKFVRACELALFKASGSWLGIEEPLMVTSGAEVRSLHHWRGFPQL